jgi:RNA polymerase-binding transcription factor DksA
MTNLKEDVKSNVILGQKSSELMQVVQATYQQQKTMLGRSQQLLEFRLEKTLECIKHDRYGICDCEGKVDEEALKVLEVFCPHCLERQAAQTAMLKSVLAQLETELYEVSGVTLADLRKNNWSVQSSHEADSSPSVINGNLTVRIPGLRKRIDALDEALQRVPFGRYGICEDCEEEIPIGRLKLEPHTKLCVPCKSLKPSDKVKNLVFTH